MKKAILLFSLLLFSLAVKTQTKSVIYFDSNKNELKNRSVQVLDSLVTILKAATDYQITINGYCDNTGNETDNQVLSEKRAAAVADHLKKENVAAQFIQLKGFSANNPIGSNTDEKGKASNRRVEIIINIHTIPTQSTAVIPSAIPKSEQQKETFTTTSSITDLDVGKTLVLKNLNFEGGTAFLLPEAKPTLEILLKTLKDNPTLEIEIGGHVCCADDMPLSILRAQSVYKYLIKNGINESRLKYKGYSRNKPIYEDDTTAERARANRRVEITVLKK
jgi:outer membrane protein OmpA-like peptidoglycan-associated protein